MEHDGAGTPGSETRDLAQGAQDLTACRSGWQNEGLAELRGPTPFTGPCRRGSQLCKEGQGWGTLANTNDTCFILCATFFVGASVKNTRGQPSLSQKERAQERDFLAAGFIKS